MTKIISFLILLIVLVAVILFTVLNAAPVTVNYHFGQLPVPLSLVVGVSLIAGAIIGLLASLVMLLRAKTEVARLKRLVRLNEKEIMNLRSIPIKDSH
jgi:putative membrane protein